MATYVSCNLKRPTFLGWNDAKDAVFFLHASQSSSADASHTEKSIPACFRQMFRKTLSVMMQDSRPPTSAQQMAKHWKNIRCNTYFQCYTMLQELNGFFKLKRHHVTVWATVETNQHKEEASVSISLLRLVERVLQPLASVYLNTTVHHSPLWDKNVHTTLEPHQ